MVIGPPATKFLSRHACRCVARVQPPGLAASQSVAATCGLQGDVAALQAELEAELEAEAAPMTFEQRWHAVGQNPAAMAVIDKIGGRGIKATRAVPVGAEAARKRVGGVTASMVTNREAWIAALTRDQRTVLASRLAVHLGLASDIAAADASAEVREAALQRVVACYNKYHVEADDRTFALDDLLPTKEYASLSMKHLKDLSCDYTTVRGTPCFVSGIW